MRRNVSTVVLTLVVTAAVAGAGTAAALAGHGPSGAARHRHAAQQANPPHNIEAKPGYNTCWTSNTSAACLGRELAAINHARALEGVKPMVLPPNFTHLSSARQTFVVTNLERTARGLRPFVALVRPLNSLAADGAHREQDPALTSWRVGKAEAWKYTSNWARDLNALAADYDYMYNDGYSRSGGTNADCQTPHAAGCWVHRENILTHYPKLPLLIAGVAEVNEGALESSAMIMVGARGQSPRTSFTWRAAKR